MLQIFLSSHKGIKITQLNCYEESKGAFWTTFLFVFQEYAIISWTSFPLFVIAGQKKNQNDVYISASSLMNG